MSENTSVLTRFRMRGDAELFQHFLVAAGIESEINGDETVGYAPHLPYAFDGLSLCVRNEDLESASEILASFENF